MISTSIITLVITLTLLVLVQLVFRKQGPQTTVAAIQKPYVKCLSEGQPCTSDVDCLLCTDKGSYQFTCQKASKHSHSYCLPKKPNTSCNEKLGGTWDWTGWRDTIQGWACNCIYPEIAGTSGCKINSHVCSKGRYAFDATKAAPQPSDCKCPLNSYLVVSRNQVPLCIPKDNGLCSSDGVCKKAYQTKAPTLK